MQLEFVQSAGAGVILMASRALAAAARGPRDYLDVYGELLKQASQPVILHWLGEAFDPALRGYWGGGDFESAAATVLELIDQAGDKVDGVKLSVLDADKEVALRRRLPSGIRLYTGDDFGYADLIKGDGHGHSDALLGAFAAVTAPAAAALRCLDAGDLAGYEAAIGPTVPLSRHIFAEPTYYYKAGVAFLAWLNGLQPRFLMLDGLERKRSADHLIEGLRAGGGRRRADRPGSGGQPDDRLPEGARMTVLDRLSLNQATVKRLGVPEAVDLCVRHGIKAIGLWREPVAELGLDEAVATVKAAGLRVSSLCRAGFFTHADPVARQAAIADNKAAIAEAAALGTGTLVLVSGGLVPGSRDIGLARRMIADAIGELVPVAQSYGVRLGIEALHPVFAADRCVITRLGEALDLAVQFPAERRRRGGGHLPRLVGRGAALRHRPRGRADRQLPGVRLDPAAARRHPPRPRPRRRRLHRLPARHRRGGRRRLHRATSRWRSSTRPSGPHPRTRRRPPSSTGSPGRSEQHPEPDGVRLRVLPAETLAAGRPVPLTSARPRPVP